MLLAERSIRLLVVILIALLIGWKVRQHRIGPVEAPPPAIPVSGTTLTEEDRPSFPDE